MTGTAARTAGKGSNPAIQGGIQMTDDSKTRTSRRGFLQTTGLAAASAMVGGFSIRTGAWAQDSDDPVAAAQAEGKVMLYTGSAEPLVIALGEAFKEEYGIQLEYQRLNSSKVAARYTAESEAGQAVADVMVAGDPLLFEAFHKKGWIADLDPAHVPGLDAWPEAFKNSYSAVISINPHTMGTNTAMVKDLPAEWEDMLRPELKGRLITVDLRSVGLVAFGSYDMLLRTKGEEFLRELGRQEFQLGSGGPASIQQVAAGGASLFFPCSTTQAYSVINKGAPVQAIIPDDTYSGVVSPFAVSAKAPNPNAARLLCSFMMSEKGQQILNAETASPNGTPGTAELKPGFVEPDMESAEEHRDKIIELMGLA
ncbi:ABC transporter substrate-binding protein [Poseidonocella sp. HB161398]|uniref:ABC transporter substrate-binding protein n=1 Tax=Poseidonocella sp. HB161398 TaxID=2320855 RepID=UPI001108AACD|nr:extracellular solute-binding protein [Poseidonocella sp. HB161398]